MRTVQDYLKDFYEFSAKASDVSRQLAFAAIAVIWLFKTDSPTGQINIPPDLIWPGILIVAALAADLLQYVVGSLIWGSYARYLEREHSRGVERHSNWLPLPIWGLYMIKIALVIGAYILILLFLIRKLGLVH
jgi:hypothetical protein